MAGGEGGWVGSVVAGSYGAIGPLPVSTRLREARILRIADTVDPGLEGVSATPAPAFDIARNDTHQFTRVPPGDRGGEVFGKDITALAKCWLIIEAVLRVLEYLVKPGDVDAVCPGNVPQ